MTLEAVKDAALADLAERDEDEPCKAVHAVAVLESLDFEDHDATVVRSKLEGRPAGKVREFAEYAKNHIPEQRQNLLTLFARKVKPV